MSSTITLESKDLLQLGKFLKSHPRLVLKHTDVVMKKSILQLERDAKTFAPSSEGTLRKGIKSTIRPLQSVVRAMAGHSVYVHEGTRPHFPPITPGSPLERWARKKNIPVFVVARSIARKGTKAQPFFDESIEANETKVRRWFGDALQNIINDIKKNG